MNLLKKKNAFPFLCLPALLVLVLLAIPKYSSSQNQSINFVDNFLIESKSASTFGIVGNIRSIDKQLIIKEVSKLKGVVLFAFFYENKCTLVYDNSFNVEDLRSVFLKENIDFDANTVQVSDKEIGNELKYKKSAFPKYSPSINPIEYKNWVYPNSYPKRIDTGNIEKDDLTYENAIQLWIRINPEEYKKMTGLEYVNEFYYTQLKKQFNKN